jgi:hypothetical protein
VARCIPPAAGQQADAILFIIIFLPPGKLLLFLEVRMQAGILQICRNITSLAENSEFIQKESALNRSQRVFNRKIEELMRRKLTGLIICEDRLSDGGDDPHHRLVRH